MGLCVGRPCMDDVESNPCGVVGTTLPPSVRIVCCGCSLVCFHFFLISLILSASLCLLFIGPFARKRSPACLAFSNRRVCLPFPGVSLEQTLGELRVAILAAKQVRTHAEASLPEAGRALVAGMKRAPTLNELVLLSHVPVGSLLGQIYPQLASVYNGGRPEDGTGGLVTGVLGIYFLRGRSFCLFYLTCSAAEHCTC